MPTTDVFLNAIKVAIEEEFNKEFEEAKKRIEENLDRRKANVLATLSIKLMNHVRLQQMGNELIISVNTENIKI